MDHDPSLLTHSMVQSPSWAATWFAASQEIPHISQNMVHYCTHKRPSPVSILGQPNPVHMPTSHFLEIHPNIIHQSTPRSPQWSTSLRFPQQDPIHSPLLTHTCHMPNPYDPSLVCVCVCVYVFNIICHEYEISYCSTRKVILRFFLGSHDILCLELSEQNITSIRPRTETSHAIF